MCISGAIFEYEADHVDGNEQELKGWGFDVKRLRASEGGASPSLDRRSPRAFSTKVSNERDGNLPAGLSPNGNKININSLSEEEWCSYAGMPSPMAYTK
jgi:hypothetical protein